MARAWPVACRAAVHCVSMLLHHFPAMALFAFLTSVAFAALNKTTWREKVIYGIKAFVLFMVIAIALGWIMYPFPLH
jgi:hypothetical protein